MVAFRLIGPDLPASPSEGPAARLLSNGTLHTLVTGDGTGFTAFGWRRVTDWTPDAVEEGGGTFVFLRDEDEGGAWSFGRAPIRSNLARTSARSEPGRVRLERSEREIEASCEIVVSPDASLELRQLRVRNASSRTRRLSITTCFGIVLHHPGAHAGHPAFSKLFVETEVDPAAGLLLARRRPRERSEETLALAHALFGPGEASYETDRARFLGRGRSLARPAALDPGAELSGTVGNVLDPVASVRRTLSLAPGEKACWLAVVSVATDRGEARRLALTAERPGAFDETRRAARDRIEAERAKRKLETAEAEYLEALLGRMLVGARGLRADPDVHRRVHGSPDDLWIFGIPPDAPLAVIEPGPNAAVLAGELAVAIDYWSALGVGVRGLALSRETPASTAVVVPPADAPANALDSARACARLVLRDGWPLLESTAMPAAAPRAIEATPSGVGTFAASGERLDLENGRGGFAREGHEYVVRVGEGASREALPPAPWAQVIANPGFGVVVSERGAAHTFAANSREHRLTPWSNDPVADPHGEALWIRDDDAGVFWSPQPGPTPGEGGYEVRHGLGVSVWRHTSRELEQETTLLVAPDAPAALVRISLRNASSRRRRLSLFAYRRLVLGVLPEEIAHATVVEARDDGRSLRARNGLAGVFAGRVAFSAVAAPPGAHVESGADRASFVGAGGSLAAPRAIGFDERLDGRTGAGLDPCFAHRVAIELAPGASETCVFVLGEAEDGNTADCLAARFASREAFDRTLDAVRADWGRTLDAVRIETPLQGLDRLVNGWLPYQVLSCRLHARTAFYQSGGAFGFRDQLQDASALALVRPDLTREQILLHAAHQFVEGDVLHWWHPPADRGTRTRFSDDLLWLPWVVARYVETTGDAALLDARVGFVKARLLADGEDEAYLPTERAGVEASVFEHCCLAIERSLAVGAHGIPLMGTGDWNDGMNRVGREGRGESVWMAFFLADVLRGFEPLCEARGEAGRAARYAAHRSALARAVEANAWDGAWYRRAWFDDGTPLGTADAEECRIDLLPQAWSVISGLAERERADRAMSSALAELLLPEGRLLRLLTPPFDESPHDPGYIQGYVPGIRENGGQYTHAATWAIRALAELDRRDEAFSLLETLLPVTHARSLDEIDIYRVEPYVVAADVYAVAPHVGRGGWTWYTGSAGWLYRVVVESLLGLSIEAGRRIVLRPRIPDAWPGFTLELKLPAGATRYGIRVSNPHGRAARVVRAVVDATAIAPENGAAAWPIVADGALHEVRIELGPEAS